MTEHALDPTVFAEMRELMEDALSEFIDTYLGNSPKLIRKIEQGVTEANAELIYHNAHQLKGGSGSIGALKLAGIATDIEQIGKAGSTDGVEPLLNDLKTEYARVEQALKAEVS
jgi:HPt (histidine-containing phosphotransfer) domain-containing protein